MLIFASLVIITIIICLFTVGALLCLYVLIKEVKNIGDAIIGAVGFLFFGSASVIMIDFAIKGLL